MNNRLCVTSFVAAVLVVGAGCTKQVSFSKDVRPVLNAKCLTCHDGSGEGSAKSGFSVKTYDDLLSGTKFGKVVIPGDAVSSTLYRLIAHKASPEIQMPPHHAQVTKKIEPLTEGEVDTIKRWIEQGALNN